MSGTERLFALQIFFTEIRQRLSCCPVVGHAARGGEHHAHRALEPTAGRGDQGAIPAVTAPAGDAAAEVAHFGAIARRERGEPVRRVVLAKALQPRPPLAPRIAPERADQGQCQEHESLDATGHGEWLALSASVDEDNRKRSRRLGIWNSEGVLG